jgi:hypothetical protein
VSGGPLWLRALARAERAVGGPVERAVDSREGARLLLLLSMPARIARQAVEALGDATIHAVNLPTHRDVQLLSADLARLRRAVEDVRAELGEMRGEP